MARNYKREYETYQGTEQQKKNRAMRNAARRKMVKAGKAHKGDGKDVGMWWPLIRVAATRLACAWLANLLTDPLTEMPRRT